MGKPETTRFAPSPTGRLHLGHAYAALFAHRQAQGGPFILRMEDIDATRCRPAFEQGITEDLTWLGLTWSSPMRRQSDHFAVYDSYLHKLDKLELLYPCFCSRKEIAEEIARAPSAPHGPEGILYPGTCRTLSFRDRVDRMQAGRPYALRLDMQRALTYVGTPLQWLDRGRGIQTATPERLGDVVLARKDFPASYHLCVTVDDHIQGVTLVTRGEDLFYATHLHRLLQALLGLNTPDYHHHPLLLDENGQRFAKRNQGVTLAHLRATGKAPADIRAMIDKYKATM